MIDLDGDGLLDRLQVGEAGALAIALNRGARNFEPIVQELPPAVVSDPAAIEHPTRARRP